MNPNDKVEVAKENMINHKILSKSDIPEIFIGRMIEELNYLNKLKERIDSPMNSEEKRKFIMDMCFLDNHLPIYWKSKCLRYNIGAYKLEEDTIKKYLHEIEQILSFHIGIHNLNYKNKIGNLIIITGPMMTGKTNELILRLCDYHYNNKKCLVLASELDQNRIELENSLKELIKVKITTHLKVSIEDEQYQNIEIRSFKKFELDDLDQLNYEEFSNYDVIAFEEPHFLCKKNESLIELYDFIVKRNGKTMIYCGIDFWHTGKPVEILHSLLNSRPSDLMIKKTGICKICLKEDSAKFSKLKKKTEEIENIIVGTDNEYISVCKNCFYE